MLGLVVQLVCIGFPAIFHSLESRAMTFCWTIRGPAAAEACRPAFPATLRQALAFAIEAVKNALVVSQVNRPLREINPSASGP
jgi:hypothetical protein